MLKGRLKKISGQVNGIMKMIDDGRNCEDVMQQVVALQRAISSFSNEYVKYSISNCKTTKDMSEKIQILLKRI